MNDELLERCTQAQRAADTLLAHCLRALRERLATAHAAPAHALQLEQARAHGVAWAATYVCALRQMLGWALRLQAQKRLGELEVLLLQAAYGEYLAQLAGGLAMSQGEMFRLDMLDAEGSALAAFTADPAVRRLRAEGFLPAVRSRTPTRASKAWPRSRP